MADADTAARIKAPTPYKRARPGIDWSSYDSGDFYDEIISSPGNARAAARGLVSFTRKMTIKHLLSRQQAADLAIQEMGISFTVYSDGENIDRAWPMDIIPRIIPLREWQVLEKGLIQRLIALNMFIDDIYNRQKILKDKVLPRDIIDSSPEFLEPCVGAKPPHRVWSHICGSDLVRDGDGTMYVLEDNLRVPSGVSYMLENRAVSKREHTKLLEHRFEQSGFVVGKIDHLLRIRIEIEEKIGAGGSIEDELVTELGQHAERVVVCRQDHVTLADGP